MVLYEGGVFISIVLQWIFLGNFILAFTPILHHSGIESFEGVCSMAIQSMG